MFAFLIVAICVCAIGVGGAVIGVLFSDEPEMRVVCGWNTAALVLAIIGCALCLGAVS